MNEHQERAGQLSIFTTCWIFACGYYGVSLSIDEFHIFKAAHRSWTLLALARISNSRCYTPAEHTVSKNLFFLRITYLRKVLFALIAKTFLKVDCLWGVIWIFVIPHYFLYFKRALCRAQTMLWFLCHDQKKCICIHLISLSFTGLLCQYTKKLFETFFEIHYYTFKYICCT